MASVVRATALRAGGACVRCRKGKTKCVYENGRAPCKNCAKGMHECYLPSESMSHGGHGVSPGSRVQQRPRESISGDRPVHNISAAGPPDRQPPPSAAVPVRHPPTTSEKLTPELIQECERVITKTIPACVAFHKPSFLQQLKTSTLDPTLVNALLTTASRHSPLLIRRYGGTGAGPAAAEHFALKTSTMVMQSLDQPSLSDIQSLCLLVIHEWGCRNAVRAYIYLGQAARMAQMYRVAHSHHRRTDPDQFLEEESFRRTLWLLYILDCFLTSSPGRYPALSSHDVNDVSLPCQDMNYHFGSPCFVRTLSGGAPARAGDPATPLAEVGEFGHIVLATKAWRNVVEMLTTTTLENFSEEQCHSLENSVDSIRRLLPMHFADKPGQINVHITMGSGYTYAMVHCLLHCATVFLNRRRILQAVTTDGFNLDSWRASPHTYTVDRIFSASHSIMSMLIALENGAEKDAVLCFPIFMLFSAFTAGSTAAYLSLKGMTPPNVTETASLIVRDGLRFMNEGSESWPLVLPWHRHLSVMAKVLKDYNGGRHDFGDSRDNRNYSHQRSPSYKDDTGSQEDAMEFVGSQHGDHSVERKTSEPPVPRRPGVTTINGGPAEVDSTPSNSPQMRSGSAPKQESPNTSSTDGAPQPAGTELDMTSTELCSAFERQLLELDDLAAFMGGGV